MWAAIGNRRDAWRAKMGIILEFRRSGEAPERIRTPAEGSLGEIIIFPGVRIERYRQNHDDVPGHAGTNSRRRVQRMRKK
jgi:hypothetical protein